MSNETKTPKLMQSIATPMTSERSASQSFQQHLVSRPARRSSGQTRHGEDQYQDSQDSQSEVTSHARSDTTSGTVQQTMTTGERQSSPNDLSFTRKELVADSKVPVATRPAGSRGVKRGKASRLPARPIEETIRVRINDKSVPLLVHLGRLEERNRSLIERYQRGSSSRRDIARAMACGTIIAQNSGGNEYRRCKYCQKIGLCKTCAAIRHASRARNIIRPLIDHTECRAVPCVFSPKKLSSYDDVVQQATELEVAKEALPKAISGWNRKSPRNKVLAYAIGIHCKLDEDINQLWPHLHVLAITHAGISRDDFENHLRNAFFKAVNRNVTFRFNPGTSVRYQLANDGSVRLKKYNRVLTEKDLVTQLAYTMDSNEQGENTDAEIRREQLFKDAGIECAFTRSRSRKDKDGNSAPPTSGTNEFPPDKLGHELVYRLSLDGSDYQRIDVEEYEDAKKANLKEAAKLLAKAAKVTTEEGAER